jgi:hypothetical protein
MIAFKCRRVMVRHLAHGGVLVRQDANGAIPPHWRHPTLYSCLYSDKDGARLKKRGFFVLDGIRYQIVKQYGAIGETLRAVEMI